jgi:hypothetical protein
MRAIVTIIILTLLSGCVNYNQPMYDDGQGVYYQGQDSVYSVSSSASFAHAAVYPWWSMDYFYLGHNPYRPWPHMYYSPYFYPHYFSVLYPPMHWQSHNWLGGYYAWRDPYWQHRYRRYCRTSYGVHRGGDSAYGDRIPGTVLAPSSGTREGQRRVAQTPSGQSAIVTPTKSLRLATVPGKSVSFSKSRPPAHSAKSRPPPTPPSYSSTGRNSLSIPTTRVYADPNKHDRNPP